MRSALVRDALYERHFRYVNDRFDEAGPAPEGMTRDEWLSLCRDYCEHGTRTRTEIESDVE